MEDSTSRCRRRVRVVHNRPAAHVVLEVGTHSRWVSAVIRKLGHRVTVANPRRVKLISANDNKTDRHDAELLAWLGRVDEALLSPVVHRGTQAQADLAVAKARDMLVSTRTKLVNHVRGTVKAFGERLPTWRYLLAASSVQRAADQQARGEVAPRMRQGQDVVGVRVRVGHHLDELDRGAIELRAREQIAECAASGRGVAGADLKGAATRELHADDVVVGHRRTVRPQDGNRDDGVTLHGVDQIAGLKIRDAAIAVGRRDGRIRRRTDRAQPAGRVSPFPEAVRADRDPLVARRRGTGQVRGVTGAA